MHDLYQPQGRVAKLLKVRNCSMKCRRKEFKCSPCRVIRAWTLDQRWRREDNFPLKDSASLRTRLVSLGLSLNMMKVRRESRSGTVARLCEICGSYGATAPVFEQYTFLLRLKTVSTKLSMQRRQNTCNAYRYTQPSYFSKIDGIFYICAPCKFKRA